METTPKDSLLEFLQRHSGEAHSFHVPGHKRHLEALPDGLPWEIDITEVPPFDNLQAPEGILAQCQTFASNYWHSRYTFYLVGGSTAGILTGIRACTNRGDQILMARNCHQSVYHAVELCGLHPIYLDSPLAEPHQFCGSVSPDAVRQTISDNPEISLAVLTSPTYEGVVSDIAGISEVLHVKGIPLLLDAAHGAHLDLPEKDSLFPCGGLQNGADLVVHSLHKMLPALTQTALLQLNTEQISPKRIQHQLSVFQSSSPSYPLMASIDFCCRKLAESGEQLTAHHAQFLTNFYKATEGLKQLHVIRPDMLQNVFAFDPAKILIDTTQSRIDGFQLEKLLRSEYGIKTELATNEYLLAVTSLYSQQETLEALANALLQIDGRLFPLDATDAKASSCLKIPKSGEQVVTMETAMQHEGTLILLTQSAGRISREYVWQYPPGVPLLTPGQKISKDLIEWLQVYMHKTALYSTEGKLPEQISVLPCELDRLCQ